MLRMSWGSFIFCFPCVLVVEFGVQILRFHAAFLPEISKGKTGVLPHWTSLRIRMMDIKQTTTNTGVLPPFDFAQGQDDDF